MKTSKIQLTQEQIELLLEIISSAELEASASVQKRHVMFLPDLFKSLSNYQNDIASLKDVFKIALKEL